MSAAFNTFVVSLVINHVCSYESPSKESSETINRWTSLHLDEIHNIVPEKVREIQSNIMRRYMNQSVDPCEDFYSYACGNWAKYNPIPQDKVGYDTFEILRENLDIALQGLMEDVKVPNDKSNRRKRKRRRRTFADKKRRTGRRHVVFGDSEDAVIKAKNFYSSCMNYELIESRGIEPLLKFFRRLGGWPIMEANWTRKTYNWLQLVAYLRKYNNDILISQWIGPDIQQSNVNIIQLDQTNLGLPTREYFLLPNYKDALKSYKKFMLTTLELMGAQKIEEGVEKIVGFEIELAKIVSTAENRLNISLLYRKMTVEELHRLIPQINWTNYLEIVQERQVDPQEKVIMYALPYMEDLVKLIERTEYETVVNYLFWRFARHRVNNLDNRFLEAKQHFYLELFGREKAPPRWKSCISQINSNMGMVLGAMFVRKYFDENSKLDTLTMTKELQESFREMLNETDWIDGPTRKLSIEKLNAMSLKIGYPDYILSRHELNKKFADLQIDPMKYFENTLNVLAFLAKSEQKKLVEPVNKTTWNTAPAVVNAYYSRNKNQIMFPAGILQPPFYHRHFPKSLNYGGIGVVIGHEITHGFDDKGKLFDKSGNLNKWWTDWSIKGFHNRSKCLINQYNNYTITGSGINIDGENTQGENVADNGGIKQSYMAYRRWLVQQDPQIVQRETLPGLPLSSSKLFFLNFAQVWCGEIRREASKNKLKTAVHSPGRFRVIGTLTNFPEFANEFNCRAGAKMNPRKKCKVW